MFGRKSETKIPQIFVLRKWFSFRPYFVPPRRKRVSSLFSSLGRKRKLGTKTKITGTKNITVVDLKKTVASFSKNLILSSLAKHCQSHCLIEKAHRVWNCYALIRNYTLRNYRFFVIGFFLVFLFFSFTSKFFAYIIIPFPILSAKMSQPVLFILFLL